MTPQEALDQTSVDSLLAMDMTARTAEQDYRLATYFAAGRLPEAAFESLSDALLKGYSDITRLQEDPALDALRSDVRWEQVLIYAETNQATPPPPMPVRTPMRRPQRQLSPRQMPNLGALDVPAPEWTLEDAEGRTVSLKDLRGKVVVMDFWATWCGPCKRSMPLLDRFVREHAGEDVVVLSVNVWDRGRPEAMQWWNERNYAMRVVFGDRSLTDAYNVLGLPYVCVIDTEGIIRHREAGFSPALLNNLVTWTDRLSSKS